ncbi:cytochrome aa3 quinol oxidase subunit III [Paenibacillus sp. FSL R7-0204]|uniref:Quinol oxidase subunit 3 n=1 Tax=Paenibacillus silagei TaxID=1670801 RepID=A0ABS4NYT7_9BACL|nr:MULTISPECIES: cytochrome aa3 quinol oxidase subunit III [Paenibacillus]OMF98705.1 cytochrome aa3 quinol oxidase subunit III [Paenibacillus sp. FSL R7-0333]ETT52335.1 cytochrome aa3 quinol oxidase subunit III [Paenibacillus sp. FSL R7-269]ETT60234.1 cytochrome aa3 quinol oxidase subunit III [Paenibacillus sp. FSL R7-277]MBP2114579.1 cytochrome aa3-600 menaquinol oxidase subunit 3 [Paenibacillus silagei]OMF95470.1 cytochrome aa3 quinol oxidase subunit III [Paenibacillus sp. FSL R7-0337]
MKIDASKPLEYSTEENSNKIFGFWVFLGAEIPLFATLFTVYFVMVNRYASGPSGSELFEIGPVLMETFLLLSSSFTIGLAVHAMRHGYKKAMMVFMAITLVMGLAFVGIEIDEFFTYVHEGATLQTSGFLSSLFILLGTHGLHVSFGLLWGIGIMIQLWKRGITPATANKTFIFSLFWHFLDVVWIFIFSFVYLKGLM